jgi:hypothetical protein
MWTFLIGKCFLVFLKQLEEELGKLLITIFWGEDTFVLHYKNKSIYNCHLGNFLLKICHCNVALYH